MGTQDKASVLQRKTRAAREGGDPRVMSPARALRLSLSRAADTLFDLALTVATVEQRRIESDEIETGLGEDGLFVLLDGAAGARAALRLDPGLLAGLIEVQTIGHVRPGAVRPRVPTRTDAAMAAPLVDALLDGFEAEMSEGIAGHVARGFRFGDRMDDPRALALALTAPEFDAFRLTVDLGPGLRTGRLDLLLPLAPPPARSGAAAGRAGAAQAGVKCAGPEAPADLATVALGATAVLDAVLARLRLPLSEAMAFRVGERLVIPRESLGAAQLVATGGHVVTEGRLGRRDGWRALRLGEPQSSVAPAPGPAPATGPGNPAPPARARDSTAAARDAQGADAQTDTGQADTEQPDDPALLASAG